MNLILSLILQISVIHPEVQLEPVVPAELVQYIEAKRKSVSVFEMIRREAEALGVRVYLFGGSAAGFAYYAAWDMRREKGDQRFHKERFDYDFSNIYASTQDTDLVIDGTAEQAFELEARLFRKAGYLAGSKVKWEVRTLRVPRGDKMALLNDYDFANQNTDSASVGLVELTNPPENESIIRDLRHWNEVEPPFLKGVAENFLHFYHSNLHSKTTRAGLGMNPEIISVIRFATKAFQFNLKVRDEDAEIIKKIIADFEPSSVKGSSYLSHWIDKNAVKLFLNAMDVNYAARLMDDWGLRKKIIDIGNPKLHFWMNKLPLASLKIGEGNGKTAKDLGITEVAHETREFLHYENITRSPMGVPNLFSSRTDKDGGTSFVDTKTGKLYYEGAALGSGFYSLKGRRGAVGSGLTIRFRVKPEARNGTDFIDHGAVVVFLNRNALEVIDESLSFGPIEFLNILYLQELDSSDVGLLIRFARRIRSAETLGDISSAQRKRAILTIKELILRERKSENHLFALMGKNYSDIIKSNAALAPLYSEAFVELAKQDGKHADIVYIAKSAIAMGISQDYLLSILPQFDVVALRSLARETFSQSPSYFMEDLMSKMIDHEDFDESVHELLISSALSKDFHSNKRDIVLKLLQKPFSDNLGRTWAEKVLSQSHGKDWAKFLLPVLVENGGDATYIALIRHFFITPGNSEYFSFLSEILKKRDKFGLLNTTVLRNAAILLGDLLERENQVEIAKLLLADNDMVIKMSLKRKCASLLSSLKTIQENLVPKSVSSSN